MKIHADLAKRAVVDSNSLEWVPSPMQGVDRRMLERDGEEVARATSLVKYAPGSHFPEHSHALGEEFLVLEGIFSDDSGNFGKGMYVRNPPGSSHAPSSEPGSTILVKLRQMQLDDSQFVRIDTSDSNDQWIEDSKGSRILHLFSRPDEQVDMIRWHAGCGPSEAADYEGGAEFFVVEGSFSDEEGTYTAGTWLRLPAGSSHTVVPAAGGALVWRKAGHLKA